MFDLSMKGMIPAQSDAVRLAKKSKQADEPILLETELSKDDS